MHIKQLELKNFKSFNNLTIPLYDGLNVINGPNGSGKSNIINSINFICGNIEDNSALFNSDNLKLKVKIIFNNGNIIEKILQKDKSNNLKSFYYLNGEIITKDKISVFLKDLKLTTIDNCGCELCNEECINLASELKEKSKQEQIIVVSFNEKIISVADRLIGVINNDKVVGIN